MPLCLSLLTHCAFHLRDAVSEPETGSDTKEGFRKPEQTGAGSTKGLKVDIVRLLGNLAFHHPVFQTEVGSLGGVELVMNQCRLDQHNPLLREWAVFALRNLLQGHSANQARVAGLSIQDVANSDELREAGISAEVDAGSGKVRVKNSNDPAVQAAADAARRREQAARERSRVEEVQDEAEAFDSDKDFI